MINVQIKLTGLSFSDHREMQFKLRLAPGLYTADSLQDSFPLLPDFFPGVPVETSSLFYQLPSAETGIKIYRETCELSLKEVESMNRDTVPEMWRSILCLTLTYAWAKPHQEVWRMKKHLKKTHIDYKRPLIH